VLSLHISLRFNNILSEYENELCNGMLADVELMLVMNVAGASLEIYVSKGEKIQD
jgi:hypothetical protein